MPRDYAKNNSNRNREPSESRGLSSWVWLLIGMVLGLIIAYAATHQSQLVGFAKSSESMLSNKENGATVSVSKLHHGKDKLIKEAKGSKATESKEVKETKEAKEDQQDKQSQQNKPDQNVLDDSKKPASPKFDFYTLLPKSQVASAEGTSNKPVVASTTTTARKAMTTPKAVTEKTINEKTLSLRDEASSRDETSSESEVAAPPVKEIKKSVVNDNNRDVSEELVDTSPEVTTASATSNASSAEKESEAKAETKPEKTVQNDVKKSAPIPESTAPFYSLQVAAYPNYGEADRLKAELILLGFEPSIKTIKKNGANWYRVWLGPYHNYAVVQSVQSQLQSKHVKSTLLKENS
jgi:cell division protein FtsN